MKEYINGEILLKGKLVKKDFLINQGKIFFDYDAKNVEQINLQGKVVAPGFVDIHVHTRIPGQSHKEDIEHLTRAALSGGFTNIVAMANISPAPVDKESLKNVCDLIKKSDINIIQVGRATNNNSPADIKGMSEITKIFSDDGLPISESNLMHEVLKEIKDVNGLILLHEEDEELNGVGYHSTFTQKNNLPSFSDEYETNIVQRDISLNEKVNARIHLQHISCAKTIELFKKARNKMDISAEVTPHHLFFSSKDINGSTNFKMNPPLNSEEDMLSLRKALEDNLINIIATDHAPHAEHEKGNDWIKSANGVIGLETAFAAVNTVMGPDNLVQVLSSLSVNPAKRIGINIEPENGKKANLVIIDPNEKWTFTKEDIKSKSKNSPFIGKEFVGKIKEVIWTKI